MDQEIIRRNAMAFSTGNDSSVLAKQGARRTKNNFSNWMFIAFSGMLIGTHPFFVDRVAAGEPLHPAFQQELTVADLGGMQLAQAGDVKPFDIPPQPLGAALTQFFEQSGVQVAYTTADVQGVASPGVSGKYTPEQALRILLSGTELSADFKGADTVTLKRAETIQQDTLPKMTVVGDWLGPPTPETVRTYSGSRSVVTEEQIQRQGTLNLEDTLRSVPNITILDETGVGILPNIGVRGLTPLRSQRIQVLQDGYPVAIGPYSNIGLSLFPITMQSIQTIDVVRGGAAVHYGPNNVGGVLNFITRPIPYKLSHTLGERVTISEETGNILTDTYFRIGGFATDKLGLQLQYNTLQGQGFRDHSDTEAHNFIFDADLFPNEQNQLAFQFQYYNVEAELPGSLSPSQYERDRTSSQRPHDSFDADMFRATLTWTYNPDADTEFEWRNFYHKADRTFFFGQNLGGGNVFDPAIPATHKADSPRIFSVMGTEPRLTRRIDNHTIIVGARYVREEVDFDVNRVEFATGTRTVARDWAFDVDAFAVYASDTVRFMNDRLAVTPGVRYENVYMDFRNNLNGAIDVNKASKLLPGITVGFEATDRLFLFANAQRSLVPVQTAQVTRAGDVANETAWNYELGGRFQITPNLMTSMTLFAIDYRDQIQFNSTTARFENLGETLHHGVELTSDWEVIKNANLRLAYTYLDTEQKSGVNDGRELPYAPHHHVSLSGDYRYRDWDFALTGLYVSESYSDAANTEQETANGSAGKLPAYTLVNARVGHDFEMNDYNLNVGLSVNNLLDEDYYFRGVDVSPVGRLPSPGRSFILGVQLDY